MSFNPSTDMNIEDFTDELRRHLTEERPTTLESPAGTQGVTYGSDDQGEFATIGMTLPEGVFAEIEDGTFGQLQGYRVYLSDEVPA